VRWGIVRRCAMIARKATSLAIAADRGRSGNVVADGGYELAKLAADLRHLTDAEADDAWRAVYCDGPQPPF